MSDSRPVFRDVKEQTRRYVFPSGEVVIERVTGLAVSNSTHRLETADGRKFIVPSGWLAIELTVAEWSF